MFMAASKQANKQASIHTRAQCSHASVWLAQVHPNNFPTKLVSDPIT